MTTPPNTTFSERGLNRYLSHDDNIHPSSSRRPLRRRNSPSRPSPAVSDHEGWPLERIKIGQNRQGRGSPAPSFRGLNQLSISSRRDLENNNEWDVESTEEEGDSEEEILALARKKREQEQTASMMDDLAKIEVESGLSIKEAKQRLKKYGPNNFNKGEEEWNLAWQQYLQGPVQTMCGIAAVLALIFREYISFAMITILMLFNAIIGFLQDYKSYKLMIELKHRLELSTTVIREGHEFQLGAQELVPGDVIVLEVGNIAPADCVIIDEGCYIQVDQSLITGESRAVRKVVGDEVYCSSVIKRGCARAMVTYTGNKTYLSRASNLASQKRPISKFALVSGTIATFLIRINLLALFIVLTLSIFRGESINQRSFLSFFMLGAYLIQSKTVATTTMAVGARDLARKKAIVSHLPAVESLAGVDILCTDKTGTLTRNKLTIRNPHAVPGVTVEELLLTAFLACPPSKKARDPIDNAVMHYVKRNHEQVLKRALEHTLVEFSPFDSVSKMIQAVVRNPKGEEFVCAKGDPLCIREMVEQETDVKFNEWKEDVANLAKRGFRALGVATRRISGGNAGAGGAERGAGKWKLLGVLPMLDPPRIDVKETIKRATIELGLEIKMLTGDHLAISREVSKQVGIGTNLYDPKRLGLGGEINQSTLEGSKVFDYVQGADGFAQVFPEHKYQVIDILQRRGHVVAMTGDGVNDAPSLRKANVGIAVKGATDAARSASDIVFLTPGLGGIIDVLITSRKIFHRLQAFLQYRVSLSLHLVFYLTATNLIFDAPALSPMLIVSLAFFSDITVFAIPYDRAPYANSPVRWNLHKLIGLALVLALVLTAATFVIHVASLRAHDLKGLTEPLVFLEIALTQAWLIISARTKGKFYNGLTSWQLGVMLVIVSVGATLMSYFGVFTLTRLPILVIVKIWLYSFGVFLFYSFINEWLAEAVWFDRLVHMDYFNSGGGGGDRNSEDLLYQLAREAAVHELASLETPSSIANNASSSTRKRRLKKRPTILSHKRKSFV